MYLLYSYVFITSKICTCDTHVFVKTISNAMKILIDLSIYSKVRWLVLD